MFLRYMFSKTTQKAFLAHRLALAIGVCSSLGNAASYWDGSSRKNTRSSHQNQHQSSVGEADLHLQQELTQLFHVAYFLEGIYERNNCWENVDRLRTYFLSRIPQLKDEDFTVLYMEPTQEETFRVVKARVGLHPFKPSSFPDPHFLEVDYLFHVALAHKGFVYDLDFGHGPHVVSFPDYASFFEKRGEGVTVYTIPAHLYNHIPEYAFYMDRFQDFMQRHFQSMPLASYLKANPLARLEINW